MPDGTSNSLVNVNLGELSKPANTLVKKVTKAVGGLFAPYQIKRVAKAEVEAAIIRAQGEIQLTDIHRRAMHRWVEEEAQRQANIESITSKALPHLKEDSTPDLIEDDWVTNFFDKSRIVSDEQMQELWSRALAGEANVPGSYSKRTVNFLSDLDKTDAEMFAKLCGFAWVIGGVVPLVFDVDADIYNRHGVDFGCVSHLESIGLIQFNHLAGFRKVKLPRKFEVSYYGDPLSLEMEKDSDNELQIGKVLLTKVGLELAPICDSKPRDGFREYVEAQWEKHLPNDKTEEADESSS